MRMRMTGEDHAWCIRQMIWIRDIFRNEYLRRRRIHACYEISGVLQNEVFSKLAS